MLSAFFKDYFAWTYQHAVGDPWGPGGHLHCILVIFAMIGPLLLLATPRMGKFTWSWRILIAVTCLQILIVPEHKFVLQMLPFLCLMAVA